jgi:SAM-dependent methyltransferase
MNINTNEILICPKHHFPLTLKKSKEKYTCPRSCNFPILESIPRFVPADNYASSFGLQWNKFYNAQLDSSTGLHISKNRLSRMVGGSFDIFTNKKVLEAGCGAGRFTEIMLDAGAHVFAVDISTAVEANYQNCNKFPNYFVCQADILRLPVLPEQFDIVVCIGVIQHTPDPEETITALCSYLKPGGLLVIDHYTYGYPTTPSRKILRSFLIRRSDTFSMKFCQMLITVLWPIHRIFWKIRVIPGIQKVRLKFLYYSPIVDYHDSYPELGIKLLKEWAVLDTHDTLTDYYKHMRSAEDIKNYLKKCGMSEIETAYAGNGVEARAKKPIN